LIYRANKSNLKKHNLKSNLPKVNAFAQAGYGNPDARQFIPNFYMLGAKAHWNVFDWDKSKKEKEALLISEAIVTTEKKLSYSPIFKGNGKNEITKLQEIITTDAEIISLRNMS
jgi:hypothetical protein